MYATGHEKRSYLNKDLNNNSHWILKFIEIVTIYPIPLP